MKTFQVNNTKDELDNDRGAYVICKKLIFEDSMFYV